MSTAMIKECPKCGAAVRVRAVVQVECGNCGVLLRAVPKPRPVETDRAVAAADGPRTDSSRISPAQLRDACYPGWLPTQEGRPARRPYIREDDNSDDAVHALPDTERPLLGEFELQDTFWESLEKDRRLPDPVIEPATPTKAKEAPRWLPALIPLVLLGTAAGVILWRLLRG